MVAVPCESGKTDAQTFPARLGQLTSPRRNFHRESEAGLFLIHVYPAGLPTGIVG